MSSTTLVNMECSHAEAAISARADNELPASEMAELAQHLTECRACAAYAEHVHDLGRLVVMRSAVPPEGMADRVLAKLNVPQAGALAGAASWVRYALGVVAASLAILNLPLLLATGESADHSMRHIGAFGLALGFGLGVAALRPERAIGLLPLAAALGGALLVGSAVDVATGRAAAAAEAIHLLELVGIGLLWLLTGASSMGTRLRERTRSLA